MGDKPIELVAQPGAFFHELVSGALTECKVQLGTETEFYLVNLLNQFMLSDRLFLRDAEGHAQSESLALMIQQALEEATPFAQASLLRRVGDISLYTAGFFQESLNRKLVDVEYYINMGGVAYQGVAERHPDHQVYRELSQKFPELVDVFAGVSGKTQTHSEKDLLRLYDVWLRTGSERAAKALKEAGILPNTTVKRDVQ